MSFIYALLIADLVSGLGHWFEDTYGNPNWKIGGSIIRSNIEHHDTPMSFLSRSYWYRNGSLIMLFSIIPALFYFTGFLSWEIIFICFLLGQVNEIHAFAHRRKQDLPTIIKLMQDSGILQGRAQHSDHHKAPHHKRMCIITNFLNPTLDYIKFWFGLEWIIKKVFGVVPFRR